MSAPSMVTGGATAGAERSTAQPRSARRRSTRWIAGDFLVSVTTLLLVLAAASTLPRLFVEQSFRTPILMAGVLGWSVATAARFARLPFFIAPILSGSIAAVYAGRFCFPDLVTSRSPAALPVRALANAIRFDWSELSATKAPVVGRLGFALSAILGVWLISALTDVLAFTLRSPIEAIVPSAVLVLVGSIVAPSGGRAAAATVYCVAAVLHVGAVTTASTRRARWTDGRAPSVVPQLGRVAAFGALAALVTAVAVPRSGLTDREGMTDWRTSNARRLPSTVASPMVSLKRQLLNLPNTVMFTATSVDTSTGAPSRTYWRLSTLTKFNGTTWTSTGSYRAIDNASQLPAGDSSVEPEVVSRVVIEELRSSWLPTSYQARSLDGTTLSESVAVGFDKRGDAIITSRLTSPGASYGLASVTANIDDGGGTRLRDSGTSERDLELPASFPPSVAALAEAVVGGSAASDTAGRIVQLRTLQEFFRRDFTYSTAVPPPSRGTDLEDFVLRDRAGYCEQFSGAFAAMARSLGIPARVVVGFSPGRLESNGQFVVTGKNSHAWPEAYLDGIGWLPFEPTPGRGIPGAENYTGVPDQDASEGREPAAPIAAPETTIAPAPSLPPATAAPAPPPAGAATGTSPGWVIAMLGAVLVGAAYVVTVRSRRRRRNQVELAWSAVVRHVSRRGGPARVDHESDRAFAERASVTLDPASSVALRALAAKVEEHRFAPEDHWTEADSAAFVAEASRFRSVASVPPRP